jgi:hypothetical protein
MSLLQLGVSIDVVAIWLGYESPTTTHQCTHANLEMKERALAKPPDPGAKLRRFRSPRLADRIPQEPVIMKSCRVRGVACSAVSLRARRASSFHNSGLASLTQSGAK